MSTVGFIGLGTMGRHMARNLIKAGHQLVFYARRPEVIDEFRAAGGTSAASPAEVARQCPFVITIVTADPQVEEVALGPDGIIEGAARGTIYLDMSTIGPDTTRRVAGRLREAGVAMLDAPVSGGPWGAEAGTLTIMVGGEEADFQQARPVLEAMGKTIVHVGPIGAGQTVKLVNQMVGGGIMTLISEGFVLAKAAGIDPEKLLEVMLTSSGNSSVLEARGRKFLLADQYEPGFRCDLMHKDMLLAVALGERQCVPLPVAAAALQQYAAALCQGHAARDFSAVYKSYEQAAGRTA